MIDDVIDTWPECENALIELEKRHYSDAEIYISIAKDMLLSQRYSKELTEKISRSMIESKRSFFQLGNVISEACAEDRHRSDPSENQ